MSLVQTLEQQTHVTEIKTRGELYEWLEINMARSYEEILEDQKLEPEQNLVKTYVVESNVTPKLLPVILKSAFQRIQVVPLEDYRLYRIDIDSKNEIKVHLFIDAKDMRFWRVFTLDKAQDVDNVYNKFVTHIKSKLDKLWIPNGLLKGASDVKIKRNKKILIRSMSIKHDESPLSNKEKIKENLVSRLRIDGSGELATEILETIMGNEKFKYMTRLTKIGVKLINTEQEERFVLEDLYYWGKFTVKGTSIDEHLEFVDDVVSSYKTKLMIIENSLIDYNSEDWAKKVPLVYEFKREIQDLRAFVESLITPREPFRIWGLAKQVEKDMYIIVGTDLHNGDKFSMEITPWWIRLYLPKGSCGNTALRLLTNIQQSHDAQTSLEVPEYGKIEEIR